MEPDEIFVFRTDEEGSVEIKNISEYKSVEELKGELEDLGITLGEKVFYGFT